MSLQILVVHGYGFTTEGDLNVNSEAICQKILKIHNNYSYIILVGGWYSSETPNYLVCSELMARWLIAKGLPAEKIKTISDLKHQIIPPRDAIEEIDALIIILKKMTRKLEKNKFKIDVMCLWFSSLRISLLYKLRKIPCRIISAFSLETLISIDKIIGEAPAIALTLFDPLGKGKITQKMRKRKTPRKFYI